MIDELDDKLYFVGRVDNQIKHMGYRIELEEIETNLSKIDMIKQCAVVNGKTKNGFSRLVAYVAVDVDNELTEENLRATLKQALPDYMIPNVFNILHELPKNANGKIDRVKLKELAALH